MVGLILASVAMMSGRASMFPGEEWEHRSPESQGMDSARLMEALEYAAGPQQLRSHCASIHRNGFLVAEGYWKPGQAFPNATTMVYSVSKTFVTTMIGAAERDGLVDTEREARNEKYGEHHFGGHRHRTSFLIESVERATGGVPRRV